MRKMSHSVTCNSCDFRYFEITKMPSEDYYKATDHDLECPNNGEVFTEHYPQ